MIQDIAPWRLRNEFMNAAPRPGDLVLDMSGEGVLSAQDSLRFPTVEEWRGLKCGGTLFYAFRIERQGEEEGPEQERLFLVRHEAEAPPRPKAGPRHPPCPGMSGPGLRRRCGEAVFKGKQPFSAYGGRALTGCDAICGRG